MKIIRRTLLLTTTLFAGSALAQEDETPLTTEQTAFFESKIRPLLVENCYRCHSADEKIRGGLSLDTRAGMRHGGDSGVAIVPGKPAESLLLEVVKWSDPDLKMPPKDKLDADEIADIEKWIEMGAPDPRKLEKMEVRTEIDIEEGKKFWAFQKPVEPKVPTVKRMDWPRSDVDHFILAKLESSDLRPTKDARADVLLRRLYFDLIGLPPSPEEFAAYGKAWEKDPKAAYAAKVDELLASERFGERWGRHWLDVARFAESTGKDVNMSFPQAWRYRDYVIDSFNADKPYDMFLKEQLAGDLLPIKNDADWQENLIATGFLAIGVKNLNEQNPRQFALDLADEQVDTTTQAILGMTVSCARCHDHKFDPIPTADYYALAGVFMSTKTYFGTVNAIQNRRGTKLLELPIPDENPVGSLSSFEMKTLQDRIADVEEEQRELQLEALQARRENRTSTAQQRLQRIRSQLATMRARLNGVDENGEAKTKAMGVQEGNIMQPVVLVRGELDKPAQNVDRGFPQVLCDEPVAIPSNSSGRRELAEWIASDDNTLTARVFVNRVWGHLFGNGIVASPNNFGTTGQAPSHPELLDHLALQFVEGGWSIKSLVRELVLTRSYQMGSDFNKVAFDKDPDNSLQWRHSPKKIDAEALRDSMLAASGSLDLERPAGSDIARQGDARIGAPRAARGRGANTPPPANYRSVYLPAARDQLPEALELFDPADGNLVTGKREDTNVPDQALYLLNNPFVITQANAMAGRLQEEMKPGRDQIALAFAIAYGRAATSDEINAAINFTRRFEDETSWSSSLAAFCQSLLISAEFRYLN